MLNELNKLGAGLKIFCLLWRVMPVLSEVSAGMTLSWRWVIFCTSRAHILTRSCSFTVQTQRLQQSSKQRSWSSAEASSSHAVNTTGIPGSFENCKIYGLHCVLSRNLMTLEQQGKKKNKSIDSLPALPLAGRAGLRRWSQDTSALRSGGGLQQETTALAENSTVRNFCETPNWISTYYFTAFSANSLCW